METQRKPFTQDHDNSPEIRNLTVKGKAIPVTGRGGP
jgi:hypothetical protein